MASMQTSQSSVLALNIKAIPQLNDQGCDPSRHLQESPCPQGAEIAKQNIKKSGSTQNTLKIRHFSDYLAYLRIIFGVFLERKQKGGFPKWWFGECTFVLVFGTVVPSFVPSFLFWASRERTSAKTTLLETTL